MLDLDHWQEIRAALSKNKTRTLLTAFGVFWGIFLLMVMIGSGNGLKNGMSQDFAGGVTNSVYIWTQRTTIPFRGLPKGRRFSLNNGDAAAIRQHVSEAEVIAPRNQLGGYRGGNNVTRGTKAGAFSVMGDVPAIQAIQAIKVVTGRFLNDFDLAESRKIAVIGTRVSDLLFDDDPPIGGSIQINGVYFKVVGVFKTMNSGDQAERDEQTIYIPFSTFQRAFNYGDRIGWFAITSKDGVPASVAAEKAMALLRTRHQISPDDKRALGHWNTEKEYLKIQGLFAGISALVWIVGVGTLAAGVIGVSNIMLVIVKERTREIGIRRSIGATPITIIGHILFEAVILTSVAGYLGLMAGTGALELARYGLEVSGTSTEMFLNPGVSFTNALQALGVLIAAGTLAGLIPAQRAVSVSPVDALRAE